jgi:Permease family
MKAIGAVATTQAAQTATITPATVYGASMATGLIWLALGLTGTAKYIAGLVPQFAVVGIVLGLGMGIMLQGVRTMSDGWIVCLAFLLSDSINAIFALFARPVLGVILFLTGAQLAALGSCDFSKNNGERFITVTTAAFSLWNVGLAFVVAMIFAFILKRGWLRL